jgi:hypothetical protein
MTIFLISNGSLDTYPNNTLTNFKNKLPLSWNIQKMIIGVWVLKVLDSLQISEI